MSIKLHLKDIPLSQLNNECMRLINRFALAARAHDGTILRVQDKDILLKISRYSRSAKDQAIRERYLQLKDEVLRCVFADMVKKGA